MKYLIFLVLMMPLAAQAAVTVSVNGTNHTIPQTNEKGWGANVTAWIQAISQYTLQPSGGSFLLTADADFGSNFGLKSTYFKSKGTNISGAGVLRLANAESIGWRNAANGGNLLLSVNASDQLVYSGTVALTSPVITTPTGLVKGDVGLGNVDNTSDATKDAAVATLTNKTLTSPVINSPTGIVKADVGLGNVDNTSDATKNAASVTLTNKTIDADLNTLSNIENAEIKAGAGIDASKIADGSISNAEFQAMLSNPMDAIGQIIYGGAGGVATKLAAGTSTQYLKSNGAAAPTWASFTAPTIQKFLSGTAQTYTPTAGAKWIKVRVLGGGGGGSASDSSGGNNGFAGNNSTFGNLTAGGGAGGIWNGNGGAGGSVTVGAGWTDVSSTIGNGGHTISAGLASGNIFSGGAGGAGCLGGQSASHNYADVGADGTANTGSGGQGGGTNNVNSTVAGSGGGAGGCVEAIAPAASFTYTVGGGGAGGVGGPKSGGAGGSGIIIVEEYYQ